MFKAVVWSSMLDYPGQVCSVLFVGKCNWACEYCHNRNLFSMKSLDFETYILPSLLKRKLYIDHIIISGGEPTLYENLPEVILTLRKHGFRVGLHTNGSDVEMLKEVLPMVSFVGMDIKASISGYKKFIFPEATKDINLNNLAASINALITWSGEHEFRTTVYPKYTTPTEIGDIANYLKTKGADKYVLQRCNKEHVETDTESLTEIPMSEYFDESSKHIYTILR